MHFQGRQLCQNNFTSLQKSVYSKRKEFAPRGSKFFPLSVDSFSKGFGLQEGNQDVTKFVSLIKMVKKTKHQGCQIISCVDKNSDFPIQSAKLYTDSARTTHRHT